MLDQSTTHRYLIITYKVHVINYTESHQQNYLDSSKQEKVNMAQLLLNLIGKFLEICNAYFQQIFQLFVSSLLLTLNPGPITLSPFLYN